MGRLILSARERELILWLRLNPYSANEIYEQVGIPHRFLTPTKTVVKAITFDPKGGIRCTVDPRCKWTGKTPERAGIHATGREDLKLHGHIAKY